MYIHTYFIMYILNESNGNERLVIHRIDDTIELASRIFINLTHDCEIKYFADFEIGEVQ
jgi:hypothetical protein